MVYRTLRKRRSKRSMKRSIKRYRRHAKTRIRRNIYRKKHKKTQRGGVLGLKYVAPGLNYKLKKALGIGKDSQPSSKTPGSLETPGNMETPELKFYIMDNPEKTFDIGDSTHTNTLENERFLQAELKLTNNYTTNQFGIENPIISKPSSYYSYYLITGVGVDTTATEDTEYPVNVKKIMSKKNGHITLSVEEYKFTLTKNKSINYDVTGKNHYGSTGRVSCNSDEIIFKIESFTPIGVETIGNTYTNPIKLEFKI